MPIVFIAIAATSNPISAEELLGIQRVGILPFETSHIGASGQSASDLFNTQLVRSCPSLMVVERSRLEKLLSEQSLQHSSGLIDPETAARLKSILGVDSVVLGSILALDNDTQGGGTLMMAARIVDTSSGRILWAETKTVHTGERFFKKVWRFFADPPIESDAIVTNRLMELASKALVQDLRRRLPADTAQTRSDDPEGSACAQAEADVTLLGKSILSEESLYWAHRLQEDSPLTTNPGAGYADKDLRDRLTKKILSWLGKRTLPELTGSDLSKIASAKAEMKKLRSLCSETAQISRAEEASVLIARMQ